jgi:ribosome maturation factor RimP
VYKKAKKYMSTLIKKIEDYIEPVLKELGFCIVLTTFAVGKLQIMVERLDGTSVDISDCEKVSRHVSVLLNVLDPIREKYFLEVSSPGIDRPLIAVSDYRRFVGKHVVIKTYLLKNNKKTFKGILASVTENGIRLCPEMVEFGFDEIKQANIDGDFE